MKISCPACAAKYSIADEKVSDRLAKIRCRKCNATIVIDGKANPPNVYTAAGEATTEASDDSGDSQAKGLEFTVDFGEGDQRTMPVSEIVAAYNAGQITQDTYLWAEGFADWKPLAEVEEVVSALNSAGKPAATASAPAWSSAAASPARAAARTAARTAPAPDLFGGIDAAGGEDDVATSAPEQASNARGGGGGGLGLGSSAAASGSGAGTGSRNESSVLFSLSALTSAASRPSSRPIAPASAPSGAATREDSGLIDLKALTAAATKSEAAAAPVLPTAPISPLSPSPLGIASPLGGGLGASATDYGAAPAKNKTGLYIGGGIAVAAIAAV
ncbi:MAG TPA: zinc-ribbon domain-containing protein, partial [Polyangiaceae bacterium]|nr:zinc-ribbon domain-containing protein [Polyangiaceae bacterium]